MDLGLNGATALVTGASAGLGYAAAAALAAEGCHVAICSRNRERIDAAAASLSGTPGRVVPLVCDVTDEDQIEATMRTVGDLFGGSLNILVTNARGPKSGLVGDFDASAWRDALDLNLISTINLCRHALPLVKDATAVDAGFARILMVTSVSAKQPIPALYLSNVSRAGVQGFAKSLAEELGPLGVTVNTVLPGYTTTERLSELADATEQRTGQSAESVYQSWADLTALKRLGKPEEFGAVVAFLASRKASYVTGQAVVVDGGRVKGLL